MLDLEDVWLEEYKILREELKSLKNCQVTYFTASVTATGLIFTVAAKLSLTLPSITFLFPLAILIPAWAVFFDKSLTISRIIGYYRILEDLLSGRETNLTIEYKGWENSLKDFRDYESNDFRGLNYQEFDTGGLRYWRLVNIAFVGLSTVCILLASIFLLVNSNYVLMDFVQLIFTVFGLICIVLAFWKNNKVMNDLKIKHSYDTNESIWRAILAINKR